MGIHFGVRTYSLALASEVRPFGIEVCVIMPGDIATGFTAARRKSCGGDDVYSGRIARSVAVMEHDEQTGMSAQFAGQFVARRATQKHPRLICTMGRKIRPVRVSHAHPSDPDRHAHRRQDLRILTI